MNESFEQYMRAMKERANKVKSNEYLLWIYNNVTGVLASDAYPETENHTLLNYFSSYVDELAQEQRVLNVPDENIDAEEMCYVVNISDRYFEVSVLSGQGSITYIKRVEKPKHCYVQLPL